MKVKLLRYNKKTKKTAVEEVKVTCLDIITERGTFFIDLNEDESLNIGDNVTIRPAANETVDVILP